MEVDYIIVQAGGKGSRLKHLTMNKPKALVPINNLPMLFHLFRKYPEKRFIIIGDYKKDVLREYLRCFADVKYIMVEAEGTGTCSGLKGALSMIPEQASFMLIWSDLILPEEFKIPQNEGNYLGISIDFSCRWSYEQNRFQEKISDINGVAGVFIFQEKSILSDVPFEGEFVRYLQKKSMAFQGISLEGTKEYGLLSQYDNLAIQKCRSFNQIRLKGNVLIKEGLNEQGKSLAVRERNWYKEVMRNNFKQIPRIYELEPLKMEVIVGNNIYEYTNISVSEKKSILEKLVGSLKELHAIGTVKADQFSIMETYIHKTFQRLDKVRNLIPFADQPWISINKRKCRNVFFNKRELESAVEKIQQKPFVFIHGDCTFSNMLLKNNQDPILIDPRGYFGFIENYGDEDYDWAKVYYSLKGNYDRFNLKHYRLEIGEKEVKLDIESNQWENLEKDFFALIGGDNSQIFKIKLLHAIIWLSLTTYAWEDYDSICGAFYNGCYYLEEVLGC